MKYKYKIRLILWLLFAGFLAFLIVNKAVPNGRISYFSNFKNKNYFISKITPEERILKSDRKSSVGIIEEPVYFTLSAPRKFNDAKLTMDFQINNFIKDIQVGVLYDKTIWRYHLEPIYNSVIENLAGSWNIINENGIMLLQKEKRFENINEFLNVMPDKKEIAVYNYSLPNKFKISDYVASGKERIYPLVLRGPYEFYVYIKNEPLDFYFEFITLNKNKDEDDVLVNIYNNNNNSIGNYQLKDDKISTDNGESEDLNCFKLYKENLPEGVYKIEVKANNDTVTKKITTIQSKISFVNKLWIFGSVSPFDMVTDSFYLSAETVNPGSLQEIYFGAKKIKLDKTYKLVTTDGQSGINKIIFSKNDIILAGNGVFAASPDELLNPSSLINVSYLTDPEKQGIKFILAKYELVKKNGMNYYSSVDFDLESAYRENNKYSFIISIPGLNSDPKNQGIMNLNSVKIDLAGDGLRPILKRLYIKLMKNE